MSLTRLLAWLGGSWAFRSPARTARLLHGFACTEEQSQLELRQAAQACQNEQRRALYLRHALDEARHARAFATQAAAVASAAGQPGFARPSASSEELYERLGEARFLAFVQRGEERGRTEFEVYARLLERRGQTELATLFSSLVRDERGHEAYTARLLAELAGNYEARRALAWASRDAAWRAFRRRGRRLAALCYSALMLLLFIALAPYALSYRWLSRRQAGFSSLP